MLDLKFSSDDLNNFNLKVDLVPVPVNTVQLYVHTRNCDNRVFYVGIGINNRPYDTNKRNMYWKRTVSKYGHNVHIIYNSLTWEEACSLEIKFIKYYRSINSHILTNMTDGGDGTLGHTHTMSERGKQSLRAYATGRLFSDETRKKISDHHKGNTFAKGMTHTEETKEKLRNLSSGRKHTPEAIQRMREAQQRLSKANGGTLSEETKQKMRKPKSEGHGEKVRQAKLGKKASEETKAKLREAHKTRKALLQKELSTC